jgi:hypothetical protein
LSSFAHAVRGVSGSYVAVFGVSGTFSCDWIMVRLF